MDTEIPEKILPTIRLIPINLVWILPLIAVERATEGHSKTAIVLIILLIIDIPIAVYWNRLIGSQKRPETRDHAATSPPIDFDTLPESLRTAAHPDLLAPIKQTVASAQHSPFWRHIGFLAGIIALTCVVIVGIYWLSGHYAPAPAILPPQPNPPPAPKAMPPLRVINDPPKIVLNNPDGSKRIFVHISPDQIKAEFEGRTDLQANLLIAPYLLKWIAFSAVVQNIQATNRGEMIMDFLSPKEVLAGHMIVQAFFDAKKWHQQLDILRKGDKIKAACRVSDVHSVAMAVDQCELFE